ncbi:MAG: hypothetical protein H6695_04385 [Deferribacteres bacterium]|nr:hypothetical protein [Deferribacteres bacterium]
MVKRANNIFGHIQSLFLVKYFGNLKRALASYSALFLLTDGGQSEKKQAKSQGFPISQIGVVSNRLAQSLPKRICPTSLDIAAHRCYFAAIFT